MQRRPVLEFVTGFTVAIAVATVSAVAGIAAAHASFWPLPLPFQESVPHNPTSSTRLVSEVRSSTGATPGSI